MSPPRRTEHSLNDVARRLAPHLRIVSASQPTPMLRQHNVVAITADAEAARRAVLALEPIEQTDDRLGTVVMGSADAGESAAQADGNGSVDPEGVSRQIIPRVLLGGLLGAIVGALVVGGAALLLGATGWSLGGAALAGAALIGAFGAIWLTFAGLGGSDAYRQTFVDEDLRELTVVSVHTDDPAEAATARSQLEGYEGMTVLTVDRSGHIVDGQPSRSTQ